MEKVSSVSVDNFLANWNSLLPDIPLTTADLMRPQAVMMHVMYIFERHGVSRDAVLMPPEDSDEHITYYLDLLPVINTIRIVNHLVSILPEANLCFRIMDLLQPTTYRSYTILIVLFNQMMFNDSRLADIAANEEEIFAWKDEVKALTEKKDNIIQMRNKEAAEKGNRAELLEQLQHDIPLLKEEVKQENEVEAEVVKELEAITEENKQTDILLEQKKAHRDGILAENARKKALKVYDAEDIRGQVEQAAQNFREVEEKLSTLSATLTQKESSLQNLQSLKPTLDQTNTFLHDIMKMAESIKELENGDLDTDGAEGELAVLSTEAGELQAARADAEHAAQRAAARRKERAHHRAVAQANRDRELENGDLDTDGAEGELAVLSTEAGELQAARADAEHAAQRAAARRKERAHHRAVAQANQDSVLKESEEKHRRACEEAERAARLTQASKEATLKHEQEKAAGTAELAHITDLFTGSVTTMQNNLLNKMKEVYKRVEEQNQRHRKL